MTIRNMVAATVCALLFATTQAYAGDTSFATWSGPYAGIAGGLSRGVAFPSVRAANWTGTPYWVTTDPLQVGREVSHRVSGPNTYDVNGALFLGINGQTGRMVYGLEADLSLDSYDHQYASGYIPYLSLSTNVFQVTNHVTSDRSFSLRPRIGYAYHQGLFYISAGPSWRRFKYDFHFNDTPAWNESADLHTGWRWRQGWSASVGYEHKMRNNWSLRFEYLYESYQKIVKPQRVYLKSNALFVGDGFLVNRLDFLERNFRFGISKSF